MEGGKISKGKEPNRLRRLSLVKATKTTRKQKWTIPFLEKKLAISASGKKKSQEG